MSQSYPTPVPYPKPSPYPTRIPPLNQTTLQPIPTPYPTPQERRGNYYFYKRQKAKRKRIMLRRLQL